MADLTKKKILVVDDEEEALLHLTHILQRANYEVFSATRGSEALNSARLNLPDLVILDVVLPDMEGGDVASTLAQGAATQDIPIIFLSGVIMEKGESILGQKTGKHYIMAKPTTPDEILVMVKKVFDEIKP